ncbi:hypothetical protein MBLNU459_g7723t1 [Dothideomycetes sp. NU459]
MSAASEAFSKITQTKDKVPESEVEKLYNALDPVTPEEVLGSWQGGSIDTGHPGHGRMLAMNWAGKDFHSINDVHPIMTYDENKQRKYAKEISGGGACLREVKFRGVVSTGMVYDAQPIIDHFRKVDANTLAGAMDTKLMPEGGTYYFFLTRL